MDIDALGMFVVPRTADQQKPTTKMAKKRPKLSDSEPPCTPGVFVSLI